MKILVFLVMIFTAAAQAQDAYPLGQLALSPQCGFGSDVVGNLLSEDDQKRKLERFVEAARQIRGK